MKHKALVTLPIITCMLPLMGAAERTISMSLDNFAAFDEYEGGRFLTYKIKSNYFWDVTIHEEWIFGTPLVSTIKKTVTPSRTLRAMQELTYVVDLPTNMCLNKTIGMKIQVTVYVDSRSSYYGSMTFYPRSRNTLNPFTDLANNDYMYLTNTLGYSMDDCVLTEERELYRFYNTTNSFYSPIYYRLPIEQYQFFYSGRATLSYDNAYLYISGGRGVFDYFDTDQDGIIAVPLSLKIKDRVCSISFKKGLYVNPVTMDMTDYPTPGFVATNNFYLPKNKKEAMDNVTFSFSLQGLGDDKVTFNWDAKLDNDGNLIGECWDSVYCIEGEVRR